MGSHANFLHFFPSRMSINGSTWWKVKTNPLDLEMGEEAQSFLCIHFHASNESGIESDGDRS
jgi:hypothetical protein